MTELRFTWDKNKARQNKRTHGVTFEEASTVFSDEYALLIDDPGHSEDEARFVLLGLSSMLRTLVVCHYRKDGDVIRIISARKASRKERDLYNRRWRK
jgi:uncharacterized DUF497 family protein